MQARRESIAHGKEVAPYRRELFSMMPGRRWRIGTDAGPFLSVKVQNSEHSHMVFSIFSCGETQKR